MKLTTIPKKVALVVALTSLAMSAAACGGSDAETGNGNGSGGQVVVPDAGGELGEAMKKAFYDPFEKATGIKVIASPGEFDAAVVLAGVKAGAPAFDLVNINASVLKTFRSKKAIQKIDYSSWSAGQRDEIAPVPAADDAVPAFYIAVVGAFDSKKFGDAGPASWQDFWDVKKFPGQRSLGPGAWGAGAATFEIAALADGVAPEDLYPIDLDRVFASLDRLKPDLVKYWESGAEPIQLLTSGQASAASAWNGRVSGGQQDGAPVSNTWNQAILQYDNWVVLDGAKNTRNAQKLLAFMMGAERQAAFAEAITYSPANQTAFDQIPADRAALLPTSPANMKSAVTQDYEWWTATAPGTKKTNEEVAIERWQKWISK